MFGTFKHHSNISIEILAFNSFFFKGSKSLNSQSGMHSQDIFRVKISVYTIFGVSDIVKTLKHVKPIKSYYIMLCFPVKTKRTFR